MEGRSNSAGHQDGDDDAIGPVSTQKPVDRELRIVAHALDRWDAQRVRSELDREFANELCHADCLEGELFAPLPFAIEVLQYDYEPVLCCKVDEAYSGDFIFPVDAA